MVVVVAGVGGGGGGGGWAYGCFWPQLGQHPLPHGRPMPTPFGSDNTPRPVAAAVAPWLADCLQAAARRTAAWVSLPCCDGRISPKAN